MYDIILELYEQFSVVAASEEQAASLCQNIVEGTEYYKALSQYACHQYAYGYNAVVDSIVGMVYDIARECNNLQDLQYCIEDPGCAAQ